MANKGGALLDFEGEDFVDHGFDVFAHLDEVFVEDALALVA